MIQAQPAPVARPVEARTPLPWRAEFTVALAAGMVTPLPGLDPPMKPRPPLTRTRQLLSLRTFVQPSYIGAMEANFTGPVAAEIHARLTAALSPTRLVVRDDSEQHRGHAGHRGEGGESHFTVEVEAPAFTGMTRLARQRAVNAALKELLAPERIHALAIVARAPGE